MIHGAKTSSLARILIIMAIALVWAYVIVRTVPQAMSPGNGDYGFFTGVADRLRAGDTLYVDVWDNKDPILFYSIALARSLGPAGAWILEILWVALSSSAALAIARSMRIERWMSALLGLALTPLIILGLPYFMGTSHLPGITLTLISIAVALRGRFLVAGMLVGTLLFAKLIMLPVLLAALSVVIWRCCVSGARAIALAKLAAGFGVSTVLIGLVMAMRGELVGFVDTQLHNTFYAQSPIVSAEYNGLQQKIAQHIVILVNPHVLAILATTALIGLVVLWRHHRANHTWIDGLPMLWWMTFWSLLAEVVVIMAAGKWLHHAEILTVSSVLALILTASHLLRFTKLKFWAIGLILAALTWPLAGAPSLHTYPEAFVNAPRLWEEAQRVDPLSALLVEREPTTFALVGQGNLIPKSGKLNGWSLACRHVAQRPFNPQNVFDETVNCLLNARLVIVTNDYGPDPNFPAYTRFVSDVEKILADNYTCEPVPDFRLCERNG